MVERLTMTVEEMGVALGVSRPKAYELASRADFPVIKVGKRKVIPVDAFRRWMEQQTELPPVLAGAGKQAQRA